MKKCIFTSYNYQIDPRVIEEHSKVISSLLHNTDIVFKPLRYNLPRKMLLHYQVLDYGFSYLIHEFDYILTIDVDCIPLTKSALQYTFDKIQNNIFIGTAQRSMHIDNNKHVYIGSPCFGLSTELFHKMGKPSFIPTNRGDTAEELSYIAEEKNIEMEIFMPSKYERDPFGGPAWELDVPSKKYGIGTTFVNGNNDEMFYHLFESRRHVHNDLFINKCKEVVYE
jgi:hypothetical protein